MILPPAAVAPVIPPVIIPMVHVKVQGTDEVRTRFCGMSLHTELVAGFVTTGVGFTVTVIVNDGPEQVPAMETGVIINSTVPGTELLGLCSVWLIVVPVPAEAPVIPPIILPKVQVYALGVVEVTGMFNGWSLQTDAAGELVMAGVG